MTASRQHRLIETLIDTKKYKHGKFPRIKDAVKLFKKVDETVWASIDAKFDAMVEWCTRKNLM